jgi:foldase protein PrsA
MKKSIRNKVCNIALATTLVVSASSLFACTSGDGSSSVQSDLAVAATVNGIDIYEDDITSSIESLRSGYSSDDDQEWLDWVNDTYGGFEEMRESTINSAIYSALVVAEAESRGIDVEDEVDDAIEEERESLESEDEWTKYLEEASQTEDSYREALRKRYLSSALHDEIVGDVVASDDDVVAFAKTRPDVYGDSPTIESIGSDTVAKIRSNLSSDAKSKAWNEYTNNLFSSADIVINDMPDDLPYLVKE